MNILQVRDRYSLSSSKSSITEPLVTSNRWLRPIPKVPGSDTKSFEIEWRRHTASLMRGTGRRMSQNLSMHYRGAGRLRTDRTRNLSC